METHVEPRRSLLDDQGIRHIPATLAVGVPVQGQFVPNLNEPRHGQPAIGVLAAMLHCEACAVVLCDMLAVGMPARKGATHFDVVPGIVGVEWPPFPRPLTGRNLSTFGL